MNNSGRLMLVCRWASVNDLVKKKNPFYNSSTEPEFTLSEPPAETPDESARLLKVSNKETRTKSMMSFWCPYV